MKRFSMDRSPRRGAVAVLLSLGFAGVFNARANAQAGAVIRRVPADSVVIRAMGVGKMDTILFLSRALDHEQYGSPVWLELTRKLDSLMAGATRFSIRQGGPGFAMPPLAMPRGWIGFNAQGPVQHFFDNNGDRVTYFAYPQILSVDPDSPADRAGIIPGDVLVAFNGTDVVGHEFNLTRLMEPETKVAVTIRRDGEMKDFSLSIAKAPQDVAERRFDFIRVPGMLPGMPALPSGPIGTAIIRIDTVGGEANVMVRRGGGVATGRAGGTSTRSRDNRIAAMPRAESGPMSSGRYLVIAPHSVFGADVSPVGADLARVLKLDKGVLVNDAPETSPAYKSGLRVGDVIVTASGQPVATIGQLQDIVVSHFGERSVVFQVMRERKPLKVTVSW